MAAVVAWPLLVAPLAGALSVLAFAPFALYPLALLGPLALLALLERDRARPFLTGWLFGLGLFGAGVSWLHVSIAQFGRMGVVAPLLITALFIALMALFYGLVASLFTRLRRGTPGADRLLLFPALWALGEWLRGWFLSGFPWLALGYAQIDGPLAGWAPVIGVYGVGWLAALAAAALWELWSRRRAAGLALGALAVAVVGGLLLGRVDWTTPAGAPLAVALIQGNVAQAEKWRPDELVPTLYRYTELTLAHPDAELVVWPETAVPAFRHRVEESFLQPLEDRFTQEGRVLVLGVAEYDLDRGDYYNAMLSLGGERDLYFKRHLVPFTEYLPGAKVLRPLVDFLTIPMSDFSAGTGRPLLQAGPYPIGMSICYEDAFGEEMIEALPEAELLINASNDAWFGDSLAPHQHLEIARMRALESGRWLLRATNTGISALIAPDGRISRRAPQFETAVVSGTVERRRGWTPYARWGNAPLVLLLVLAAGVPRAMRRP